MTMPKSTAERVAYGDDENQFFELWRPELNSEAFAVFIHGGFWRARYDLHHADEFCSALAGKGLAVGNLEYRRVGQSGAGWPSSFHDVVNGVKAAITYLGSTPVLIGHSAGGHLALRLTGEAIPLKAVVALAPVADLRLAHELNLSNGAVTEFLGGTPESVPRRYDEACPSAYPSRLPIVILHGSEDEDVPIVISQRFVEQRKDDPEPPRIVELPGAGHMDLIDPETPAGKTVIDLILRLARK